jgi:uncharacterized protein DUF6348
MTEVLREVAFRALCRESERFSGSDQGDGTVFIPPVEALLWVSTVNTSYGSSVLSLEIFADHEDLPEPIVFVAVGSGGDYRHSAGLACEQWFQVVFPVLHSAFAGHETLNVKTGKLHTQDGSGRTFEWITHPGPIRTLAAGEGSEPEEPKLTAMLQALMNDIAGVSASTIPFWIDAYAGLRDDGEALSDCRLTNMEWEAGTSTMAKYAAALDRHGYNFLSHRQFTLFMPVSAAREPLRIAPPPPERKPWWKRIIG